MEVRDYTLLSKSNWFASDIAKFYGISMVYANNIKNKVEELYGVTDIDKNAERQTVSADNVIKVMGGKDRLTELQIYKLLEEIKNGK